jgi:CRP-like cAMP-binding protein
MRHRKFAAGEILVRVGDPPHAAYLVLQGEVEVARGARTAAERLGRGQVIGETALVLGRPSSIACKALTDATVLVITRDEFLAAVDAKENVINPFMRKLFESLIDAPGQLAKQVPSVVLVSDRPKALMRLLPSSSQLATQMLPEGYDVTAMPFRVGRKVKDGESGPTIGIELTLEDDKPFNLSRQHFAIESSAGGPVVKDIWSQLGTMVNGVRIGRSQNSQVQVLVPGENVIVAGRTSSPFVFRLIVN